MAKEKANQKKLSVTLGSISLGKKDTAKISVVGNFSANGVDANEVQALLAAGQLKCRLDRAPGQLNLDMKGVPKAPPTTVEFEATCHRIGMDLAMFMFGLSFPKSAAEANTLAAFAGQEAKLIVTRTGDLGTVDGDEDGEDGKDEE